MFNNENRIIKKLSKNIKIKSFLKSILTSIELNINAANVEIKANKNDMTIHNKNTSIYVKISDKGIIFTEDSVNEKNIKEYIETEKGYVTKIRKEMKNIFDLDKKYSINKTTKEVISIYDTEEKEIYRRNMKKEDNYYEDKITKEKTLHSPNVMENYTENNYSFRIEDKYVVQRSITKYVYPEGTDSFIPLRNTDSCYLRYETIDRDTKVLPDWGHFYGIDNDVFFNYKQSKATTEDLVENFKSKKYRIPEVHYS